ncbi:hypothetical protein ACFU5O_13030 [Streptomyces sp. NPDC057445]|uniref:hypothetical protein n=1 Tax=Streptomyces sp. NPDC057445 TaxID=3346136 RepID=UPI0036A8CE25
MVRSPAVEPRRRLLPVPSRSMCRPAVAGAQATAGPGSRRSAGPPKPSEGPLALRGVRYTPTSAHDLLRRNLAVYGLGGLVLPFVGIKLIDLVISTVPGLG